MPSSLSLPSQAPTASASFHEQASCQPDLRRRGPSSAAERRPPMIGALDFGSVYQNTVISPEDGLAPSWGDVVIEGARWVGQKAHNYYERTLQTLPRLKKTLPRWIDSQKRQYPIADERRFLYNGAFAGLGELNQLLLDSGDQSNLPLAELERVNGSLANLKSAFDEFIQLRKMEKDEPFKALAKLLISPSRDTLQSHLYREYLLPAVAQILAMNGVQFLTSAVLSQFMNTLPQSVQDAIVREVLGEEAVNDPDALSKAISKAPEYVFDQVEGLISRQLAEELLASHDLTEQGRECLERVVDAMDKFSHPPSTFLNEVNAEPWESYAVQAPAAAAGQTAATYFRNDPPFSKSLKTALSGLLAGSLVHFATRLIQGKIWDAFFPEALANTLFTLVSAFVEPEISARIEQHAKSGNTSKYCKILALAVTKFILKEFKMAFALALNGKNINSLGGMQAHVRNAAVTIAAPFANFGLQMGLNRWYDYSKKNSADYRFSSQVVETAEAVDNLIEALQQKLSQNELTPEQHEAFTQALQLLEECKRIKECVDNWNPGPEAISSDELSRVRDATIDQYATLAQSSAMAAHNIQY